MSRDALVVGINTYQFEAWNLKTPGENAEAIAQILERYGGFRVKRLPEVKDKANNSIRVGQKTKVTSTQLEDALVQLFKPEGGYFPDTALLYFSGHGLRKDRGIRGGNYLVTSDVNPDLNNWGVSLQLLRQLLQDSPVRKQIIWLDCCYAGGLINMDEANPGENKGYSRCFIAGSREFEVAKEDISGQHGVMTKALLYGLDASRCQGRKITNYTLIDTIIQYLEQQQITIPQRPLFSNVGEHIELIFAPQAAEEAAETVVLVEAEPYKGLQAFDFTPEDAQYFYGRTALTDELLEKICQQNFLAVLGASGSGKSSVVRAGLLYQLQQGKRRSGTEQWEILPIIKPGEHPLHSLADAFIEPDVPSKRAERLRKTSVSSLQDKGAVALAELVADYDASCVVLVVDQFEEVFTLCQGSEEHEKERQQFFECLLGALEQTEGKLRVVITMRADFYGKCLEQQYAGLTEQIKANCVPVTPLTAAELREAITKPAELVGLKVEPELVQRMIADVQGSPGSLPLLEFALTELWEQWREQWQQKQASLTPQLKLTNYEQLGGVKGALEKQANQVYEALSAEEKPVAQCIFLALTQLGEGIEDTRRRVWKRDLINEQHSESLVNQVIGKLADARLLVTDEIRGAESEQTEVVVDVAHEALIRHWSRLRDWVDTNREAIRTERKIQVAAEEWRDAGKPEHDYLWGGVKLAAAESYCGSVPLSNLAQEFIQASRESQEEEIKRERELRRQAEISEIDALNSLSQVWLVSYDQLGALLAAVKAGRKLQQTEAPADIKMQTLCRLWEAVYKVQERNRFQGHSGGVNSVSFSPDGEMIASASHDGTVKVWHKDGILAETLEGDEPLFTGAKSLITSVSFSPNGDMIASVSVHGKVILRRKDGKKFKEFLILENQNSAVHCVSFSPDGQTIALARNDHTVMLYSLERKTEHIFHGHLKPVRSVSFSPDGQTIASASDDCTIKLWNLKGDVLGQCEGHSDAIWSVSFSPVDHTLASASSDGTVKLWNLKGKVVQDFSHNSGITSLSFSRNGQMIASACSDRRVNVWTMDGKVIQTFQRHSDWINSVSFSPDGKTLASASSDGTVRFWCVEPTQLLTLKGHRNIVSSASFSQDGEMIASASYDHTVKLWGKDGTLITTKEHSDEVKAISFTQNGKTLVAAGADGVVKLWNLDDGQERSFPAHDGRVNSVSFSRDGQTMALVSNDGIVKLWNLNRTQLPTFERYSSGVWSISLSPDGQVLASARIDGTVELWDINGNTLPPNQMHDDAVISVSFSPDSQIIASASKNGIVKLWHKDGSEVKPFQAHHDWVNSISFSPDGQILASASADFTVKLWSLDGKKLQTFEEHQGSVRSVSFSPDGKTLASASLDGTVILWNLDLEDLLRRGCNWLQDYLKTNPNVSDSDRHLCDGIGTRK
jgi:WD40 repeat protein